MHYNFASLSFCAFFFYFAQTKPFKCVFLAFRYIKFLWWVYEQCIYTEIWWYSFGSIRMKFCLKIQNAFGCVCAGKKWFLFSDFHKDENDSFYLSLLFSTNTVTYSSSVLKMLQINTHNFEFSLFRLTENAFTSEILN